MRATNIGHVVLDKQDKLSNMACMNATHPKWQQIVDAARTLGVGDWAIRKWVQRGSVPPKWQVEIVRETNGEVSLSDFNDVTGSAR